jgi:ABC-type transporter Mla subunit MlaD
MRSIVQPLESALSGLGSFSPADFASVDTYFRHLGETFDRLDRELGQIEPPTDVRALHDRLTRAGGTVAAVLEALARRLGRASSVERQRILASYGAATQRLLSALNGLRQAADAIAAKGYRFDSTAGK